MLLPLLAYLATASIALAGPDDPFWIVSHAPLMAGRLDPIISPGGVSGHTHQLIGSNAILPTYTYDNSESGSCTTANIDVDMSNYWIPALYRKAGNGTVSLVPLSYANTYYQMRRTGTEPVYEFPPGFRMMAGDPSRHTVDVSDPAQNAVRFACLGVTGPETNGFPTQSCPDGLRAEVYFPHCWDGVNNWLPNSAHVSYGTGGGAMFDQGDACPATHPKRIMGLFFEFIFKDDYPYEPGARVFATGDDTGYSMHGDFTNGWPEGLFSEIFAQGADCNVGFAIDQRCDPLKKHFTRDGGGKCRDSFVPKLKPDEDVVGPLNALPGNNPFFGSTGDKMAAANYVEKTTMFVDAKGNKVQPEGPGTQLGQIRAETIRVASVKGDPAYSGPTLMNAEGGTAAATQAMTTTAVTSAMATTTADQAMSSTTTADQAMSSITADQAMSMQTASISESSATSSLMPTTTATDSASGSAATSSTSMGPGGNMLVGVDGGQSSSYSSAAARATSTVKSCGRNRRRSRRSAHRAFSPYSCGG